MHTYRQIDDQWWVGYLEMEGDEHSSSYQDFIRLRAFTTEWRAAAYVSFLNGGDSKFSHLATEE
jgi:hypothetical protein